MRGWHDQPNLYFRIQPAQLWHDTFEKFDFTCFVRLTRQLSSVVHRRPSYSCVGEMNTCQPIFAGSLPRNCNGCTSTTGRQRLRMGKFLEQDFGAFPILEPSMFCWVDFHMIHSIVVIQGNKVEMGSPIRA